MAIIVEEEGGNKINYVQLAGWGVIFIAILAAAYFLFFQQPSLVPVTAPSSFGSIAPISGLTIQPDDVLNSPSYQALKAPSFPLPTPNGPVPVGRSNPFLYP